MSNKFSLPNGIVAEEAEYKEQFIDEYNSNPFVQALPVIRSKEEIIKILGKNIKISKKEIEADEYIRIYLLQRIYKNVFQVLPVHLKVWNMIDTLIRQGYVERNPFNPVYKRHINKLGNNLVNKDFSMNISSKNEVTESNEDYCKRKIRWAVGELQKEEIPVTVYKIQIKSGFGNGSDRSKRKLIEDILEF